MEDVISTYTFTVMSDGPRDLALAYLATHCNASVRFCEIGKGGPFVVFGIGKRDIGTPSLIVSPADHKMMWADYAAIKTPEPLNVGPISNIRHRENELTTYALSERKKSVSLFPVDSRIKSTMLGGESITGIDQLTAAAALARGVKESIDEVGAYAIIVGWLSGSSMEDLPDIARRVRRDLADAKGFARAGYKSSISICVNYLRTFSPSPVVMKSNTVKGIMDMVSSDKSLGCADPSNQTLTNFISIERFKEMAGEFTLDNIMNGDVDFATLLSPGNE